MDSAKTKKWCSKVENGVIIFSGDFYVYRLNRTEFNMEKSCASIVYSEKNISSGKIWAKPENRVTVASYSVNLTDLVGEE